MNYPILDVSLVEFANNRRGRVSKYPFEKVSVGQSFYVPLEEATSTLVAKRRIRGALYWKQRNGVVPKTVRFVYAEYEHNGTRGIAAGRVA